MGPLDAMQVQKTRKKAKFVDSSGRKIEKNHEEIVVMLKETTEHAKVNDTLRDEGAHL